MVMIVLFSVLLLTLTLPEGIVTISTLEKCILKMSSIYQTESQYCSMVLESKANTRKANVCGDLYDLFDGICKYNASLGALDLPKSQNVSKANCVLLCADIDSEYLSSISDVKRYSCTTLCNVDHEAVAVLVALVQLKSFIADIKPKENNTDATVTDSTPVNLKQINSTSDARKTEDKIYTKRTVTPPITGGENETTTATTKAKVEAPTTATRTEKVTSTKVTVKPPITDGEKETTTTPTKAKVEVPITARSSEKVTSTRGTVKPPITDGENETTTTPTKAKVEAPITTTRTEKVTSAKGTVKAPIAGGKEKTMTSTTAKVEAPIKDAEKDKLTTPSEATDPSDDHSDEVFTDDDLNIDDANLTDQDKPDKAEETDDNHDTDGPRKTVEVDETSKLDDTPSSYHFLIYFLAFIVLCVAAYIVFHNKHKIIAFIVEGKQGRRGGRPSTKQYTPLKSKVEDVMPFIEKSTTQSNYIY